MALKEDNTRFSFVYMRFVEYQKNMDPSLVHKNGTKNVGKILIFFITFLYTYFYKLCDVDVLIICFKQVF